MDVVFVTMKSEMYPLQISPSDTVQQIKHKIQERYDIPAEDQAFYFNSVPMENPRTAESYGVADGSHVQLFIEPSNGDGSDTELGPQPQNAVVPYAGHPEGLLLRSIFIDMVVPGVDGEDVVIQLEVDLRDKVWTLRDELERMEEEEEEEEEEEVEKGIELPGEGYYFVHNGRVMDEHRTFASHHAKGGDLVQVVYITNTDSD